MRHLPAVLSIDPLGIENPHSPGTRAHGVWDDETAAAMEATHRLQSAYLAREVSAAEYAGWTLSLHLQTFDIWARRTAIVLGSCDPRGFDEWIVRYANATLDSVSSLADRDDTVHLLPSLLQHLGSQVAHWRAEVRAYRPDLTTTEPSPPKDREQAPVFNEAEVVAAQADRKKLIDDFLRACNDEDTGGVRVRRLHIWRFAKYTDRQVFQLWQRSDCRAPMSSHERFTRILNTPHSTFVKDLKKQSWFNAKNVSPDASR